MIRAILAFHLALLTSGTGFALEGAVCPDMERPFPAPANEVVEVIAEWFGNRGYHILKVHPRPGVAHLRAWNARDDWEITVRPRSALAAVATVVHTNAADIGPTCRHLREYVDGYLLGTASGLPAIGANRPRTLPAAVLDHMEATVCIRARSEKGSIQCSGFIVDPAGLVLCTAHDLTGHQRVTLTFHDGTSAPGEVTRLDLHRDLALIECLPGDRGFVSLSNGRNLLGMGETLFSIGCPNNLQGTLTSGTVNGPPRRVTDQPFWQVNMDIFPGSSGSPVFDARGRLVAVVKGRYRGTSTVGFLIPLETVYAFLLNHED
jgi:serine protease Do